MNEMERLRYLYEQSSKHSNYQILPKELTALVGNDIHVKSRHEMERLDFILKNIDVRGKSIVDIGGNTGFFSFEMLDAGAERVDYIEGNKVHCDFVSLASQILGRSSGIRVMNRYVNFDDIWSDRHYDVAFLLNVLHHLGDDYGDRNLSMEKARNNILKQLNSLADKTSVLVFQLGFNWKGNRNCCLFENGTKKELIDFIVKGTSACWVIQKIGVARETDGKVVYDSLNDRNVERDDSLGEFLNRPIFIFKSKRMS